MNELKIIQNEDFGSIRTIQDENGKILFCGLDIARALGYVRPDMAISQHCKNNDAIKHSIVNTIGKKQLTRFIGEGDVYRLIIKSKLPQAEKFEVWVFEEVLPSIRKYGGYIENQENLTREEFITKALKMSDEISREKDIKIRQLEDKIEQNKNKIMLADAISSSKDSISVEVFAKILTKNGFEIGQNRLFRWFKEKKYLAENNLPYQKYMNMQLFEVSENPYIDFYGEYRIYWKTLITPKGQQYFIKKFEKLKKLELAVQILNDIVVEQKE